MTLGAHLIELRNRLVIAAVAIALALVVGWLLSDWVRAMLRQPILDLQQQGREATIQYLDATSGFDTKVQIALFIAVLIASPVWLYQIWAFIVPGLTRRERRYAVGFIAAAVPLFFCGIFAGWSVLPNIIRVLSIFQPTEDAFNMEARSYLDLAVKLLLAVGAAFVMPVLLVLLNFLGILRGASILKSWRVAVLCIVLFAAIATPAADLMSMFLLAVPIVVLYFLAIGIALWHDRIADRRQARELADYELDGQRAVEDGA